MAIIKEGYDGKETQIRVDGRDSGGIAELWIEQKGLSIIKTGKGAEATYRKGKLQDLKDGELFLPDNETLAYMTIQEAIALRDELNVAIKEMAGV